MSNRHCADGNMVHKKIKYHTVKTQPFSKNLIPGPWCVVDAVKDMGLLSESVKCTYKTAITVFCISANPNKNTRIFLKCAINIANTDTAFSITVIYHTASITDLQFSFCLWTTSLTLIPSGNNISICCKSWHNQINLYCIFTRDSRMLHAS